MNRNKLIIIGGGVGPLAGLHLHRLIIENTPEAARDQDHLRVLHCCLPDLVPDRTEALLGGTPEQPAMGMARVIKAALKTAQELDCRSVIGIPCNTFHAPPIWQAFLDALGNEKGRFSVKNMVEETVQDICLRFPRPGTRVGLLSTTGTRRSGIFSHALEAAGMVPLEVPAEEQDLVHQAIYDPRWGLKATTEPSIEAREVMTAAVEMLIATGAEAVILGCTELPLALPDPVLRDIPLVDPMRVLAGRLINA
jgi:aspartate racemase